MEKQLEKSECEGIGVTKVGKNEWSEEEIKYLKENYLINTMGEISIALGRGVRGVWRKAHNLGLFKGCKDCWSESDLLILKTHFPVLGKRKEMLDLLPNKSYAQVKNKAAELKLKFDLRAKWIGKKFHNWTILEKAPSKGRQSRWFCKCDCGTIAEIGLQSIKNGDSRSCGCYRLYIETTKVREKRPAWKGYEEVTGAYLSSLRGAANRRKMEFSIDCKYLYELLVSQKYKCALTGLSISPPDRNKKGNGSVDRIDSTKGYIEGNVQWVHKDINLMKWDFAQEDFIKYCNLVTENNK